MLPSPSKPLQVISCTSQCFRVLPSASKYFQVLPSTSKFSKRLQVLISAWNCFLLLPCASWSFLVLRSTSKRFTQYAEDRCYPKKRCLTKLFKFKKFSIKQAFFINDISYSQVKVHKQKKI